MQGRSLRRWQRAALYGVLGHAAEVAFTGARDGVRFVLGDGATRLDDAPVWLSPDWRSSACTMRCDEGS